MAKKEPGKHMTIAGQQHNKDSTAKEFWSDNKRFAALFNEVGTPLKPLFLKMIDPNSVSLPRIDDVDYHEGMGYSCLIHSKVFLVGNKELMEKFGVEFPMVLTELKLKDCRFPVYVAYQKQPAGIFIASFERLDF